MSDHSRRLSDKILRAFNQACDQNYLDVAEAMIRGLELALTREGGSGKVDKRQDMSALADAWIRLKALREASIPQG
jgi:hypothetical protein